MGQEIHDAPGLLLVGLGVGLEGVHHVGEFHAISDEEYLPKGDNRGTHHIMISQSRYDRVRDPSLHIKTEDTLKEIREETYIIEVGHKHMCSPIWTNSSKEYTSLFEHALHSPSINSRDDKFTPSNTKLIGSRDIISCFR
eukprot:1138781-Pelagomonas_calceolata.AAC.3